MLTSDGSNICVVPKSFELELELDFERILCVFFFSFVVVVDYYCFCLVAGLARAPVV